jgi:hypothetical protein
MHRFHPTKHRTSHINYETCEGPGYLSRYSESLWAGRTRDRNPVGVRISAPFQAVRGAHLAYYTMDTGSFPGVKRPGRGVNNPPHLARMLKKE